MGKTHRLMDFLLLFLLFVDLVRARDIIMRHLHLNQFFFCVFVCCIRQHGVHNTKSAHTTNVRVQVRFDEYIRCVTKKSRTILNSV